METIVHTFGVDWKLLTIQIVNFLILLFLLKHFLYAPLLKFIDDRRALIAKGVNDAAEAATHLAKATEESHMIIKESAKKADEALSSALASAALLKEKAVLEAETLKSQILKEATLDKERMRQQALREAEAEIVKLSILGAEKILRKES